MRRWDVMSGGDKDVWTGANCKAQTTPPRIKYIANDINSYVGGRYLLTMATKKSYN